MQELIFTINKADIESLGAVRCIDGLEAALQEEKIWLKGWFNDHSVDIKIKQLPVKESYVIDEQKMLFLPGGLTPVAVLPIMNWTPLKTFITVDIPVAALPGKMPGKIDIKLIRSVQSHETAVLKTSLKGWKTFAETAPRIRLQELRFAVSENDTVLIMGQPLPTISGSGYWFANNMIVPNGYDFELSILPGFINEQLNSGNDFVFLFDTEGRWEKIDKTFFVPASRSAIRLTKINSGVAIS